MFFDLGAEGVEVFDGGVDAVGFFDAEFSCISDGGGTGGKGASEGEDGDFVDKVWDFVGEEFGSGQLGSLDGDVSEGFGLIASGRVDLDVGAHSLEDSDDGVSGGVEAEVFDGEF